jgi:hypothetical protein
MFKILEYFEWDHTVRRDESLAFQMVESPWLDALPSSV